MIDPELKHTIRKMIREAIRWQNKQVLFTCEKCCFYQPATVGEELEDDDHVVTFKPATPAYCTLDRKNRLILAKRMPTQMPDCFTFDPLESSFAGCLTLIHSLGVETFMVKHGWATIVSRIAQRADKFGYVTGVTQRNLDKYGS